MKLPRIANPIFIFVLLVSLFGGRLSQPASAMPNRTDYPIPLPSDCDGVAPGDTEPCCMYGYSYLGDSTVAANIHIQSLHGSLDTVASTQGSNGNAYYSVNLKSAPLSVVAGEEITITASYNGMSSQQTWTVQNGSQQVDLGVLVPQSTRFKWMVETIPVTSATSWGKSVWTSGTDNTYVLTQDIKSGTTDVPDVNLLHWNGSTWRVALSLPGYGAQFVYGTGPSDVWFSVYKCTDGYAANCGPDFSGRLFRSIDQGITWVQQTLPAESSGFLLTSIKGSAGNLHVRANRDGYSPNYIFRFNGINWDTFEIASDHFPPLTMLSDTEGYYLTCWGWGRWNGSTWQYHGDQFDFCDVYDMWGTRDQDNQLQLYAIGANNYNNGIRVWKFNEGSQSFGSKNEFAFQDGTSGRGEAIWGSGPKDIYVAGVVGDWQNNDPTGGRLYHYDGVTWQRVTGFGDISWAKSIYGSSADNVWVTLSDRRILHTVSTYTAPMAHFTADSLSGIVPLRVLFSNQSTGDITAWNWNFGDGKISGARYPIHFFETPGTYTVNLKVSGPAGSNEENKLGYITVNPKPALPVWTFMLYLAGDNDPNLGDLSPYMIESLKKLKKLSANSNLRIVVQFDEPGNNNTWRYLVRPDVNYNDNANLLGERNMGSPSSLAEFVLWARGAYPAQHYYLAIADHGAGIVGTAWDWLDGDYLTVKDLGQALNTATLDGTQPIDIVHYDSCLMDMLENGYEIKSYAQYMIASQNLGWGIFAYDQYAAHVNADTTPETLATSIVSEYEDNLLKRYLPAPFTLAALYLPAANNLQLAVSTLASELKNNMSLYANQIVASRDAAQKFDSQGYLQITNDDEYLDLYHFAHLIQQNIPVASVQNAAQAVINAVNAYVIVERHHSGNFRYADGYPFWNFDNAHGVSIYFPRRPSGKGYGGYMANIYRFTVDSSWDEFLKTYYGILVLPPEPVDPTLPPVLKPVQAIYMPLTRK
jgi:PKD repeat protein